MVPAGVCVCVYVSVRIMRLYERVRACMRARASVLVGKVGMRARACVLVRVCACARVLCVGAVSVRVSWGYMHGG